MGRKEKKRKEKKRKEKERKGKSDGDQKKVKKNKYKQTAINRLFLMLWATHFISVNNFTNMFHKEPTLSALLPISILLI